ncbi:MAG TPA: glycosyltransferase [Acidimicrobiia bacterium]|nr:glycosyltransferase [Acidimicrobiia bacterium]
MSPTYMDVPSFLVLRHNLLETIAATPELAGCEPNFVLVDDTAGRDSDIEKVRDFNDTRVIEPPFNLGHQRAIVFGLRKLAPEIADDDLIVTLDSDGQDRAEDVPHLLEPILNAVPRDRTVVLARRTSREESLGFKIAYLGFRVVFRTLTGRVVRSGNFAAYRGVVGKQLLQHPYFDLCYSSTFIALDTPIEYVPCPRGPRYEGESRMTSASLVQHGFRMLMPFIDRIAVRALALLAIAAGIGFALLATVFGIKLFTDAAIPGWATYATIGALLVSLVALSSSIILFATFSQSRGISLSNLDREPYGPSGESPQRSD